MNFWNKLFGGGSKPTEPKAKVIAEHVDAIMDIDEAQRRGDSAEADRLAHEFVKSRFEKHGIKIK
jgi:hypothetical protein